MNNKENPFISLLFNIILPVAILNQKQIPWMTPLSSLFLALSFPISYGLVDYFRNNKHKNILSIFGTFNILLTGGFALFTLKGIWFAVKEATIPFFIGSWVLASSFTKKSLMGWVVKKSSMFQSQAILKNIDSEQKKEIFEKLLKKATLYFSLCFFFSAFLNFILGLRIFQNLEGLPSVLKQEKLNEQIADMTWISFLVIGLPLTLVSGLTLWWFIERIKKLTSLSLEQIVFVKPSTPKKESPGER